uniref:Uncharacterized protein n=1 Tax=Heterosigma akashiwo TaxID=2829 RepID=A0A6V1PPA3_HETAK
MALSLKMHKKTNVNKAEAQQQENVHAAKQLARLIFVKWKALVTAKSHKRRKLEKRLRQEQQLLRKTELKNMVRRMLQVTFNDWKLKSSALKAERLEKEEKLRGEDQHRLEIQKPMAWKATRVIPTSNRPGQGLPAVKLFNHRAATSGTSKSDSLGCFNSSATGEAQQEAFLSGSPCGLSPLVARRPVDPVPVAPRGLPTKGSRGSRSPRIRRAHASAPVLGPISQPPSFPKEGNQETAENELSSTLPPHALKSVMTTGKLKLRIEGSFDDRPLVFTTSPEVRHSPQHDHHHQQYFMYKKKQARAVTALPEENRRKRYQGALLMKSHGANSSHLDTDSATALLLNTKKTHKPHHHHNKQTCCRNTITHLQQEHQQRVTKEMKEIQKIYFSKETQMQQTVWHRREQTMIMKH